MPFKSEKQRRYLWANEPEIARDWADTYGSRIKKSDGGITNVAIQGGVDNYLGEQPQVKAPRKWQSGPDSPATELAYITEAEKDLILKANIHGGLEGGPNMGPSGIMSLDSFGDVGGAGASGGDTDAGGGASQGAGTGGGGFSGRSVAEMNDPRDKAFQDRMNYEKGKLQNAERFQANTLGYNERANIANATYGPLQKYTGERGFLGNLFRGANKYGYTDTYTSGPNQGQVKPGYFGRAVGGLGSLLTGIPFVGGAIGSAYDYGKGIFGRKPRDMSQFNRLGLGGIKPGTLDFDPDAKIQDTMFNQEFDINDLITKIDNTNLNTDKSYIDLSKSYGEFDNIPVDKYKGLKIQRNYLGEPIGSDLVQEAKLNRNEETELGVLKTQKESEDIFGPLTPEQEQRMKELLQKEVEV